MPARKNAATTKPLGGNRPAIPKATSWFEQGLEDLRTQKVNIIGLVTGGIVGILAEAIVVCLLKASPEDPVGLVSIGVGSIAFIGSIARVYAHFNTASWSKGLDVAGKTLAMSAAAQVLLLGLYKIEAFPF